MCLLCLYFTKQECIYSFYGFVELFFRAWELTLKVWRLQLSTQHPSSTHSHLSLAGYHCLWMNLNSSMSWCWSMISSPLLFRSLWGKLHCWSVPFSWRFRKPFKGIALPFRYTLPLSEFLESLEIKCRERTLLFFVTRKSFPSSLLIACSHCIRLVLSVRKLKYDIFSSLSPL